MSQGSEIYQALTPSHKCISHLMNWLRQSKLKARPLILIRCYIICFAKIIVNWMKWQLKAGEVSKSLVAIMQLRYLHLRHCHQPSVLQFERVSWQQWTPDQFLMGLWLSFGPVVSYLTELMDLCRNLILQRHYVQLLLPKTRTSYLALSIFDDVTSLTYFDFWWVFEPIVSPDNKDFLFDLVNFIVEPLRVVFTYECA